jgi:hypothetical protein
LKKHRGVRTALLAAGAAAAVAAIAPVAAQAAVSATMTGDDGNPIPLGGTLNIRNMSPEIAVNGAATDNWKLTVVGPNGAKAASDTCGSGTSPRPVDYVGNGAYSTTLATYAANDFACTGAPTAAQSLPFTITASTALGPPPAAALTRPPGLTFPNTVTLAIDLNPGALSTDVFYERNAPPNPDGSLPGAVTEAFPDTTARTVGIRLDKGPGTYYVAAHAKGFTGTFNPQTFAPWAQPVGIRAFAPFDLQKFRWTDSRGPSYRFSAVIRATGANGRVNVAVGRGSKGKYHSLGTAKIRRHKFSKRFRLSKVGKYRIRFKYKGNSTVAGGYEIHKFQITRRVVFRGAAVGGGTVEHGTSVGR